MLERLAPFIFVFLWSTGFVGAKYGLPYAEPFTFLALRMAITLVLFGLILSFFRARQSQGWPFFFHSMVSGVLIHACYLGAVFWAIDNGMPAGIASLLAGLQPLMTLVMAWLFLGETVVARQVLAFLFALVGVAVVIVPKLELDGAASGIVPVNILVVLFSIAAISLGTVYQKRFVASSDLVGTALAQYLGAFVFLALLSAGLEEQRIEWSGHFIFALTWLVLVLSVGAVLLLLLLIRTSSSTKTASLFYLVPVSTSLIAWPMFGETLTLFQLAGMAIVIFCVAMADTRS